MENFKKLEITDFEIINPLLKKYNVENCDHCFFTMLIWSFRHHVEYTICENTLFMRTWGDNSYWYLSPVGELPFEKAVHLIIDDAKLNSYRIKIYPNIFASMQEFALKINSALAYDDLRKFRHQILERGTPLLGTLLAPYMVWNSPLKNYAGLFDYTLAYYELIIIDKSVLNSKIIHKELPKKLQKLVL